MYRWVFLTIAAIPVLLAALRSPSPSLIWWTVDAMEKVRPDDSPPRELNKSAQMSAARNEFESFQIVFRAESQAVEGMDVDVSDFDGPDHAILRKSNVTVYFERCLNLPKPSSIEGMAGEWPDALIPREDRYFHEKRSAFPFRLTDSRNQPVWIEVYIPESATPGIYHGSVSVSIQGKHYIDVPVTLQIWNFALPATSSLVTTFGMNGLTAVRQHYGKYTTDEDVIAFTNMYRKAALWHRLSVNTGSMIPPRVRFDGNDIRIDWSRYDEEVAPFLDGTAIKAGEPLYGAKVTSIDMVKIPALNDEKKVLYWRAFADHFRKKGWLDRLFNYLSDEPKPNQYSGLLKEGQLVHSADPKIRNLVTASFRPDWAGTVDIFAPLINCFAFRPGRENSCDRNVQQPILPNLWWYQSCASHGCDVVGGQDFHGWPSYMIDAPAVANRIMPWLAWKYGIAGELYYGMNESYSRKQDAWDNVNISGGNGDGTLFYPGRPRTIGGRTDIPIESIRLKLIREGLEDYEYFVLLAKLEGREAPTRVVDRLVTNAYTYSQDPGKLYALRAQLGDILSRHQQN